MSTPIPDALNRGVYGWCAVALSREYTADECAHAITQIMADSANANPLHASGKTISLYTKAAEKRMEALSWAIYYHKQGRARQRE